jgi:hypothetical protein
MICRALIIILFLLAFSVSTYSQRISVNISDSTQVSDSIVKVISKGNETIGKLKDTKNTQFTAGNVEGASFVEKNQLKRVYSEKFLHDFNDSLKALISLDLSSPPLKKELSEDDLVHLVNQKFPSYSNIPSSPAGEGIASSMEGSLKAPLQKRQQIDNLSNYKLPTDKLLALSPLPGSGVKSKYLDRLDSLRKVNLQQEKLRLEERTLSDKSKVTVFKEKPTIRQRSYFEGVISIMSGKQVTLYQASPAMGLHFTDYFSIGGGPSIQLQSEGKDLYGTVGLRVFSKVEFFQRQFYLQLEDAMNPYRSNREKIQLDSHNVMIGGGVLLSVRAPFTLNFSVLYKLNEGKVNVSDVAPFVFRIGISSVKIEK